MRKISFLFALVLFMIHHANSQEKDRYIEVTGSANVNIKADRINYLITIKEYFKEEFDGKSKPENYRTKVLLKDIESELVEKLKKIGISLKDITIENIGEHWRETGKDFLVSKRINIVFHDTKKINELVSIIDTKGINSMEIGEMESNNMDKFEKQLKIDAVKNAREKAECIANALNVKIGKPLKVTEMSSFDGNSFLYGYKNANTNNQMTINKFKEISKSYSVCIRFEITD